MHPENFFKATLFILSVHKTSIYLVMICRYLKVYLYMSSPHFLGIMFGSLKKGLSILPLLYYYHQFYPTGLQKKSIFIQLFLWFDDQVFTKLLHFCSFSLKIRAVSWFHSQIGKANIGLKLVHSQLGLIKQSFPVCTIATEAIYKPRHWMYENNKSFVINRRSLEKRAICVYCNDRAFQVAE